MELKTLIVNFHEDLKDYVTVSLYDSLSAKHLKELEIVKPWDKQDYTTKWKKGLIAFVIKKWGLDNPIINILK